MLGHYNWIYSVDDYNLIKLVVTTMKEIHQRIITEVPHDPTVYADPTMLCLFPSHHTIEFQDALTC